jgi:malonate transporter
MSVLSIVMPIFVLVVIGYAAARAGVLSDAGQRGISEFAFNYAMPALLFRGIAGAGPAAPGSSRIAIAYFAAAAGVWLLATILTRFVLRRPAIDAATVAMSSCFGNIVMIGIPLVLTVVGDEAAAPMAILLALHSPLLWIVGTLHQQHTTHQTGRSPLRTIIEVARELVRNPLLLAIAAGLAWRLGGLQLPAAIDNSVALMAQAGVPCAQMALGASLTRFAIKGQVPTLSLLLILKLLVFPLAVYVMAVEVFALPKAAAKVALIFATMPAGANAYLFAERTGRVINSTSGAIAVGTLLGALSVTLLIANLDWLVAP